MRRNDPSDTVGVLDDLSSAIHAAFDGFRWGLVVAAWLLIPTSLAVMFATLGFRFHKAGPFPREGNSRYNSGDRVLPAFDHLGYLPAGIHQCSIEEVAARFGSGSEERETEIAELLLFIDAARTAGVRRLLVNGSFVTSKAAPNDVDVVILPGADYPGGADRLENDELQWPFLQIIVAADDADFEAWAADPFGTDRRNRPKGVVEVLL